MTKECVGILMMVVILSAGAAGALDLKGPWLGQDPPGIEPVVFAPGVVSTGIHERDLWASPDGKTIWFGVMTGNVTSVLETRLEDGAWSDPVAVPFHTDPDLACFEPTVSADGDLVMFLTNEAAPGQEQGAGWANQNIFYSRRSDDGWSEPAAVPAPITSERAEFFPSLATDGTLYFTREDSAGHFAVYSTDPLPANDAAPSYEEPVRLPDEVNIADQCYNAYAAPDESFIVACVAGHPENLGRVDYWISFRAGDGTWQPAVNMGAPFNGPGLRASSASISPDGRFFFFSTNREREGEAFPDGQVTAERLQALHTEPGNGNYDIWWVDSAVLDRLRVGSN